MQTNIAAGKKKRKRKWDAIVRQQISGSQPGDPRDHKTARPHRYKRVGYTKQKLKICRRIFNKLKISVPLCLFTLGYCVCPLCGLTAAYCLLPTACCLLPTAYCLLPAACCLLPSACCLLPAACCLLLTCLLGLAACGLCCVALLP